MSKFKILIILINLALLGLQFLLTSSHSASGREMAEISSELSSIQTKNYQLRQAIWDYSSLAFIQNKASAIHLVSVPVRSLAPLSTAMVP